MTYDVFHILHDDRQLRMFRNSKNEVYLELSTDAKDWCYVTLSTEEAVKLAEHLIKLTTEINETSKI